VFVDIRSVLGILQQDFGAFLYDERPEFVGFRLVMCGSSVSIHDLLVIHWMWTVVKQINDISAM